MQKYPVDDLGFHPKWVMPFYIDLGGGLFSKSKEGQEKLAQKIYYTLEEISDEILYKMLTHQNWRPRSAAGWLIAFGKKSQFVDQISQNLHTYPQYSIMYCFALDRISEEKAIIGLKDFLDAYLNTSVAEDLFWTDGLPIGTALVVLKKFDTKEFDKYYPRKWDEFVKAFQIKHKMSDEVAKNYWNLESSHAALLNWEQFAEQYFPKT
jgi:hypothetical protein